MRIFDIFRRPAEQRPRAQATSAPGMTFGDINDPAFRDYVRNGIGAQEIEQLQNTAVLRCISLNCKSIGMLPFNLIHNDATKAHAVDHPVYKLLKYRPNTWQTPNEFKSAMQLQVLLHGNAYAQVIRSAGRVIGLVPLLSVMVNPRLDLDTLKMTYQVTERNGTSRMLQGNEVLHLRDLSMDSVKGLSRVHLALNVIDIARDADTASSNLFKTGVMAGGAIEAPKGFSDTAYTRMQQSLTGNYSGAANIRKWMLLEEGAKANQFAMSAADAQLMEQRNQLIADVARVFDTPRPLLMMDETSWGSGIEQLGIYYVQYGLQPWFVMWEQGLERALLTNDEVGALSIKANERALLRGTLNDQAAYLSKALGAGGQAPIMTQNEARDILDMPRSDDPVADQLRNPMTQKAPDNESSQTA